MRDARKLTYRRYRSIKDNLRRSRYLRHVLAAKRAYRIGVRVSTIRYLLTSSILKTAPCPVSNREGQAQEVHIACYWRDYLQAVWALKTFYRFAKVDYPLVVHIDGFITRRMIRIFTYHFPGVTIIGRDEADRLVTPILADRCLHRLLSQRTHNVFVRKMVDFHLLSKSPTILVMDSDILFFKRPLWLLHGALEGHDALFMRDCSYCYTAPIGVIERIVGTPVVANLNAGLGLIKRGSLDFRVIEDCLQHPEVTKGDPTFLEQTLYAVGLGASKVSYLPSCYLLSMESGVECGTLVARHYAGDTRELMTNEGMTHLIAQGFVAQSGILRRLVRLK